MSNDAKDDENEEEESEEGKTDQAEKEGDHNDNDEEKVATDTDQELKEEPEDDEAIEDNNLESEATDNSNSPFKRPSDAQSIDGSSKGGRERHLSMTSVESESENSIDRRQSVTEEMSAQYAQQLALYRKPIVGQDTVCMFCLTRCSSKNPQILTCLHSACHDCFKVCHIFNFLKLFCK